MSEPTPDPSPLERPARSFHWAWWITFGLLSLLPATWAGDAPFVLDEPQLIIKAFNANQGHYWEGIGLLGSTGRIYGPLPTWIYQIGLKITSDPIQLVRLRAIVVMAITLLAAGWIARLIAAPPGWVVFIGLSPYLLFYARQLWDNSFNIPLAAVAVALVLHALIRRALWPIPLLAAVFGMMLLIHPMSIALAGGALLTLAIFSAGSLSKKPTRRYMLTAAAVLAVIAIGWWIARPYLIETQKPLPYPPHQSLEPNGWWFALLSPRSISGVWLQYLFSADYLQAMPSAGWFDLAQIASSLVFLLTWIAGAITLVPFGGRTRGEFIAGVLGVSILASQIILNGLTHSHGHPHYYNATWIAAALLTAVTLIRVGRLNQGKLISAGLLAMLCASVGFCSISLATQIHQTAGTRDEHYGPTIANQLAIVRDTQRFDPTSPVRSSVPIFPESLLALGQLTQGTDPPPGDRPKALLLIRYVNPQDPNDGRIELVAAR